MHLPGDILSQLMHPPQWHFVPLSQYESPYLGQSLRVSQAYLGYILGNFWAYLRHICKKTIVQLAFLGRQIVPSDKLSHFLPRDKMSQLMHWCIRKWWKVVGTFCRQWFWATFGRPLSDFWEIFERLLRDFWETFERLLGHFWETFGRLSRDFRATFGRLL